MSRQLTTTKKPKPSLKKKKPVSISKLKSKLWDECKRIIRARYQRDDGRWNCFTCGAIIEEPKDCHTGHFIPSSTGGALLRHDLRNLRPQDYRCNINGGGQGAEFYRRLVEIEGQEYVDNLFRLKHQTVKADHWWYQEKILEYKVILK